MSALALLLLLGQLDDAGAAAPPEPEPGPADGGIAPAGGAPAFAPQAPPALALTPSPTGFELAIGRGVRVAPVLIADLDARLYGSQDEGYNGFNLTRARVGLRASLLDVVDVAIISRLDGSSDSAKLFEGFVGVRL